MFPKFKQLQSFIFFPLNFENFCKKQVSFFCFIADYFQLFLALLKMAQLIFVQDVLQKLFSEYLTEILQRVFKKLISYFGFSSSHNKTVVVFNYQRFFLISCVIFCWSRIS